MPNDSHEERCGHQRLGGPRDSDRRLRRLSLATSLATSLALGHGHAAAT
jgi:hypothetical protein